MERGKRKGKNDFFLTSFKNCDEDFALFYNFAKTTLDKMVESITSGDDFDDRRVNFFFPPKTREYCCWAKIGSWRNVVFLDIGISKPVKKQVDPEEFVGEIDSSDDERDKNPLHTLFSARNSACLIFDEQKETIPNVSSFFEKSFRTCQIQFDASSKTIFSKKDGLCILIHFPSVC